ncbi:hypothetical protein [Fischerella thermalis]
MEQLLGKAIATAQTATFGKSDRTLFDVCLFSTAIVREASPC